MRRLLGSVLVVVLAVGCATPVTDKVSLDGPLRSTTTTGPVDANTATTAASREPVEVARWSGREDTDTENFTVDKSWELHWKVSGQYGNNLVVTWTVPGQAFPSDYLAIDSAEGSSLIRAGGTFYLSISSFSTAYEVWIVDVPN